MKICHLYPDVMNLYGDSGNITCMVKRLEWRGIDCEVVPVTMGQSLDAEAFGLVFIGSGREDEQLKLLDDLHANKARALKTMAEAGKVILAIGGGFELLGKKYKRLDGREFDFAGVLDMRTEATSQRATGNYAFETAWGKAVAFENHSGKTWLGNGLQPLGKTLCGTGNNGSGDEGVLYKNVFGSYGHGPLLPKNPELCDEILRRALGVDSLAPLDNSVEFEAREYMLNRLGLI